jgi:ABC-2 type transport system permease protein
MISLRRVGLVARRDFLVTVSSKGFIFGVLFMPLLMGALIWMLPKLMQQSGAQMSVEVALLDQSDAIASSLRQELDPQALAQARAARNRGAARQAGAAGNQVAAAAAAAQPVMPQFTLKDLGPEAKLDGEKTWAGQEGIGRYQRRALVVVPAGAVVRSGATFDTYEFYAARNLPEDAEDILHGAVRQALVAARLRATGVDPAVVRSATEVAPSRTQVVGPGGKQQGPQGLNRLLPFIMGILIFMGVMMGGQALMTSTVEEKSSRVVEVLLAAVSPLELMWGKLLGQMAVSLVTMGVYVALGVLALLQFAMSGLVDPLLILYLFLFFLTTYLVFGALMQTIGAAVNQMADAQSLLGPVMMLLLLPYMLSPMIGRAPNSTFSIAVSFIPPLNTFAMMSRLASDAPPPAWQVWLTVLVGIGGAAAAVWFAAKVFRIGLLMHGKPPNFATLIKWARAA